MAVREEIKFTCDLNDYTVEELMKFLKIFEKFHFYEYVVENHKISGVYYL